MAAHRFDHKQACPHPHGCKDRHEDAGVETTMERPAGTVSVSEILPYLQSDRYLGKREAAEYLSLSARTIDSLIDEIPSFVVGRKRLFKRSELDEWIEVHRDVGFDRIVDEVVTSVLKDK